VGWVHGGDVNVKAKRGLPLEPGNNLVYEDFPTVHARSWLILPKSHACLIKFVIGSASQESTGFTYEILETIVVSQQEVLRTVEKRESRRKIAVKRCIQFWLKLLGHFVYKRVAVKIFTV
jgi:hypothetical protein